MNVNKESLFLISNSTNFIYLIVLDVFLLKEIHYFKTSLNASFLFFYNVINLFPSSKFENSIYKFHK